MYEYVKSAKRGGVSSVSRRFECSKDGFDVIKTIDKEFIESLNRQRNDCPDTILYIDSTNLYGRIQCERLPIRSYDFLDKKELKYFDLFMKTRSAWFWCDFFIAEKLFSVLSPDPQFLYVRVFVSWYSH